MIYSDVVRAAYDAAIKVASGAKLDYRVASTIGRGDNPKPPWCDITVKMAETSVKDIGDGPHVRRHGILYVSLFGAKDDSEGVLLDISDKFTGAIELSTQDMLEFGCSTVNYMGLIDGSHTQCVVSFPFHTQ